MRPDTGNYSSAESAQIGVIGLAVMGENLALNIESKGFTVAIYNRTASKMEHFADSRGKGKRFLFCRSLALFCASLEKPRKVLLMIKAGNAVDEMIEQLLEYLEEGDIIIDGGNSNYKDTIRRCAYVESKGLFYVGSGVSGGEEGALKGPSLMPGGSEKAWESLRPVFEAICAKTEENEPCCAWIGTDGAGHYVKMVHNGIEYGDMQLICEAYQLMRDSLEMSNEEMSGIFRKWDSSQLHSYLIGITADILAYKDENGCSVLDYILDTAGQKGTGKWTGIEALNEGVPLTLISEAVFARCLSSRREERLAAAKEYASYASVRQPQELKEDKAQLLLDLQNALYAAKIISYAQGFMLLREAAKTYKWKLDYGRIAMIWRNGCIIRSSFLGKIHDAYRKNSALENILLDDYFREEIIRALPSWRRVCVAAIKSGIPMPAFQSALSFFDGYCTEKLPANLLQAQRDYFGAHTYERIDTPRGEFFHTDWTGEGGDTASSSYNA